MLLKILLATHDRVFIFGLVMSTNLYFILIFCCLGGEKFGVYLEGDEDMNKLINDFVLLMRNVLV
jgi:hypothetical protein